ncbi:HlyIII-domain-containing protein [Sanghuangporus baumii]|uniref:HlyIII-domain-containing protein n=1 Tax=Sanghuangporus baumii TaxID=108892 RepID=A0A9Q5N7Q6_SANBA|nr:HlyIII-domain-containing protein [Sanghuangporus baumii]
MDLRRRNPSLTRRISHAIDEVKTAENNALEYVKTLTWYQLEEWQKDNEYIVQGYRRAQNNWKGCFHSIFGYLHNETVNIHSHLWGAVLFLVLFFSSQLYVMARYPTATWVDSTMFSVFIISAVVCLTSSSFYHMAGCHSERVARRCHALDYSGIVVLIVGSFFPAVYYAFFCEPVLQGTYLSGAAFIVLNPEYSKPTHRGARTKVFIALGLSAVVPLSHALLTHGLGTLREEMGVHFVVLSGALYIFGAVL